jgi:predicted Zn-dependent protease
MLFGSALLASTVLAALFVDRLPGLVAPLVPHRMAVAWSDVTEAGLSSGHRRCMAPRGQAALSALVAQLATAAGLAETPAVIVLDSAQVNAFSLPDGRIVVLRGLIRTAEDPDELAGVLAHELGHVRHGDATREALRAAGLHFLADSLGWEGALVGHVTTLSYSRQAEAAADQSALETLRAAGLRADGLGRFIARLGGDAVPAFLSDHPGNADRAAALRVSPNGRAALTPESWAAVKGLCTSAPAATAPALLPL